VVAHNWTDFNSKHILGVRSCVRVRSIGGHVRHIRIWNIAGWLGALACIISFSSADIRGVLINHSMIDEFLELFLIVHAVCCVVELVRNHSDRNDVR
jgi:hypothetical protein